MNPLTRERKSQLRSHIFRHLDGLVTAPVAFCLHQNGCLDEFLNSDIISLSDISNKLNANEGYLNVGLRVLASQGWLNQKPSKDGSDVAYETTSKGREAFELFGSYEHAVRYMPDAIKTENYILNGYPGSVFNSLQMLIQQYRTFNSKEDAKNPESVTFQVARHIEGCIAGPLIVALGRNGLFNKYFSIAPFEVQEFSEFHSELEVVIEFFQSLGWFTKRGNTYNFTDEGLFFAKRAGAYGVTVSYLPMFTMIQDLIFGDPEILWKRPENSPEIHVDRAMNVWGSGSAHSGYFKQIDEVVLDLFNRPLEKQPKGFIDMGCGDGSLLAHIFDVIWNRTERGKILDEHPLFIFGADYNEAAITATRNTLNQADIWAKVVWGDIGDPDQLAELVQEKYDIDLSSLLHVRSFLDHNRIFHKPSQIHKQGSDSSGAFSYRGERLRNQVVESNLQEHLEKWKPYVSRYGLLVIELHTISPNLTSENIGKTPATAYDATHGFSDQYILELDIFLEVAARAGLKPDPSHQFKFPNSSLATVSINLLKG